MTRDFPTPPGDGSVRFPSDLLTMIESAFLHEIQQKGLSQIVRLMGGGGGYFYVLDGAPDRVRIHNIVTPEGPVTPTVVEGVEDLDRLGHWSSCLLDDGPLLRNEPAAVSAPLIDALEPLHRELGVAVRSRHKVVAIVGVVNRETDYTPADADRLRDLGHSFWRVILRKRMHDQLAGGAR